jgi:hypothetical protein
MSFQIKRKAVPQGIPVDSKPPLTASPTVKSSISDPPPAYEFTKMIDATDSPTVEGEIRPDLDEQLEHLHLETGHENSLSSPTDDTIKEESQVVGSGTNTPKSSKFQHALVEIKHFAGGLITHPFEATKHYSVLRHSHGFVFYQGPTTSVAITVFSDQDLPTDRTLWLQRRGFSGKTGLKVGTLGSRSAWIDVTPSIDATADSLPPHNERAWQRDIAKFIKKARNTKNLCNHRPYETHIVRIPHVADDGYFRIVLCAGRKVLCPSPVFRYASSSSDPSVLRGASLRTMPLELGIRVGSLVAHKAANAAAAGALQPAVTVVQNVVQPYQSAQWAATTVYNSSGAADKVNSTVESINQQYEEKRVFEARSVSGETKVRCEGGDDGPESPYPIRFSGKAAATSLKERNGETTVPLDKLVDVPQDTLTRLSGVYFGWASMSRNKSTSAPSVPDENFEKWLPAVVIVTPERGQTATVVERKAAHVHIIQESGNALFFNVKVSLMIMGFIRPTSASLKSDLDLRSQEECAEEDIAVMNRVLRGAAWQPETVLERIRSASSSRSFTERVADVRQSGQRQLDKVSVHRLGVRTDSMGLKDQRIGNGGICIKR